MIDNRTVGKTISMLRLNKGMTQQQLAATLNVSHQAVSKWENGAALPDIQTMMELTKLFGVTVEQLLNGEVSSDRLEVKPTTIDEHIKGIGNLVNNFVGGIFHAEKKEEPKLDCEYVADKDEENVETLDSEAIETEADDTEAVDIEVENTEQVEAEASESEEQETNPEAGEPFDIEKLLQMAPFMSKPAVDSLLMEHGKGLTAAQIARFAPFISRECLEKLIQSSEAEITWETLQRIAPFLKRDMVDKLARASAKGEKFVKKAVNKSTKASEDLGKTLDEVSQKIGTGMEKAIRKAAKISGDVASEVGNAINDMFDSTKGRAGRVEALRKSAFDRAIQDDRWEWIAAHIKEIDDEALCCKVAQKANAEGMHDWVLAHMPGYADTRTIEAAIDGDNWDWLGDNVWQFEDEIQEKIAMAAAEAENWTWLSDYAEQISLKNCAGKIAIKAYEEGAHVLAIKLAEKCMNRDQRHALANVAVADEDFEFLVKLAVVLDGGYFGCLCIAQAQAGNWECVQTFADRADALSVERLMELAIAEGNFEAIDVLEQYLK